MKLFTNFMTAAAVFLPVFVHADTFIYSISNPYSSNTTPTGGSPWATITFQDTASNHVKMTISMPDSMGSQFISQLNFNFNPSGSSLLNSLRITNIGGIVPDTIKTPSANNYNAGPAKDFDFQIEFETSNKYTWKRLDGGSSSYFDITGTGLTASMFNFTNDAGLGPFYTAVHIQNISGGGDSSVWAANGNVEVPEPSTYLLLATLLGGISVMKHRQKKMVL